MLRTPLNDCSGGSVDLKFILHAVVVNFAFINLAAVIAVQMDADIVRGSTGNLCQSNAAGFVYGYDRPIAAVVIAGGIVLNIKIRAENPSGGLVDIIVVFGPVGVELYFINQAAVVVILLYPYELGGGFRNAGVLQGNAFGLILGNGGGGIVAGLRGLG